MKFHKWCTNHQELLAFENRVAIENSFYEQRTSLKILGVLGYQQSDCFLYKLTFFEKYFYSKQDCFSIVSKIFDPLGLIGSMVTRVKIFMQSFWLSEIDWTEPLLDFMKRKWTDFAN